MNITSWIGAAWAALKGAFSFGTTAKLSVVDYILDKAHEFYSNVEWIASNLEKAYRNLVWVCDKLDYYKAYIPTPWASYYEYIQGTFVAMRNALEDGKFDREEIVKIAESINQSYRAWNK